MKDVEQLFLRIPGVTEAQVFVKVLVFCKLPITDAMRSGLNAVQEWIEEETGWGVIITISAGKRPPTANELARELCLAQVWKRTSDGNILTYEPQEEGE